MAKSSHEKFNDSGLVLALDTSETATSSPSPKRADSNQRPHQNGATPLKTFTKVSEGVLTYEKSDQGSKKPVSTATSGENITNLEPHSFFPDPLNHTPPSPPTPEEDPITIPTEETTHPEDEQNPPSASGGSELVGPDPVQDRRRELTNNRVVISELEKKLELTKVEKEKIQRELCETKKRYNKMVSTKNAEIDALKDKVVKLQSRVSSVEKTNEEERVKHEKDISKLQDKLKCKEAEHSSKVLELKLEIRDHELKISKMETEEEVLKRKVAEANEETHKAKLELNQKQSEEDQRRVRDEMMGELERRTSVVLQRLTSLSSSASSTDLNDLQDLLRQLSFSSTNSSTSMPDAQTDFGQN